MSKLNLHSPLYQIRNLFLSQPKRVLFEHVPKCGGTTVIGYLKSQYFMRNVFSIDGSNTSKSINRFLSLPEKKRHSYGLVQGHGAHKLRKYTHPDIIRATILRDPVDRIISHYYYVLRTPNHYLYNKVAARKMSLVDYATSNVSAELRNNYVSRFLEMPAKEVERAPDESIKAAINILREEYSVVGTLDDLSLAMHRLADKALFHDEFKVNKLNVTANRPKQTEVDQSILNAIAEANKLDAELYKMVKENSV